MAKKIKAVETESVSLKLPKTTLNKVRAIAEKDMRTTHSYLVKLIVEAHKK